MFKMAFVIYGWDSRKHEGPGNKLHDSEAVNQGGVGLPKEEQCQD